MAPAGLGSERLGRHGLNRLWLAAWVERAETNTEAAERKSFRPGHRPEVEPSPVCAMIRLAATRRALCALGGIGLARQVEVKATLLGESAVGLREANTKRCHPPADGSGWSRAMLEQGHLGRIAAASTVEAVSACATSSRSRPDVGVSGESATAERGHNVAAIADIAKPDSGAFKLVLQ